VDCSTWDQPFRSPGDTRKYIQKIAASGRESSTLKIPDKYGTLAKTGK